MDMSNENKDISLEAIAEQWVNLLFANIEAKKQEIINISKNRNEEEYE